MVLEYSDNGSTWITTLPTPSTLSISAQDLDDQSYRSVTNGNIIRQVVGGSGVSSPGWKWQKVTVAYNGLKEADAVPLMTWCKNANDKWIRVYSPFDSSASGGHYITTIQGYVSQIDAEWIQTGKEEGRWTINFSFIEGRR